jgi:DNA polymerase-3 subunit gamma/tau
MYQALYRKWRPLTFSDVVGQQHITDTLKHQLMNEKLSHAYLFTGTRGTGKTTCAKILARAVNCEHLVNGDPCNVCPSCRGILDGSILDVVEIDAASNNGVDNIRDIREESRYTPANVKKRVYIIDEVHMLSAGAFNALLKTLEEPPAHVLFILATTEIHKVPATILSRCQRFDFRRIAALDMEKRLKEIAEAEKIPLSDSGAKMIARLSDGAMRDALSILDRAASVGADTIDENMIAESVGILSGSSSEDLMRCIRDENLVQAISLLESYYIGGRDLGAVLDQLLGLIRDLLLVKTAGTAAERLISPAYTFGQLQELLQGVSSRRLLSCIKIIQNSLSNMPKAADKKMEAELCFIQLCRTSREEPDSLSGRLEELEEKVRSGVVVQPPTPTVSSVSQVPAQEPAAAEANETITPMALPKDATKTTEEGQRPQAEAETIPAKWPEILQKLMGRIPTGTHTMLKLSSRAKVQGQTYWVLVEDDVTATLAHTAEVKAALAKAVEEVMGNPYKIQIITEEEEQNHSPVDDILKRAEELQIETKTMY